MVNGEREERYWEGVWLRGEKVEEREGCDKKRWRSEKRVGRGIERGNKRCTRV